jgi:hypothetical protein
MAMFHMFVVLITYVVQACKRSCFFSSFTRNEWTETTNSPMILEGTCSEDEVRSSVAGNFILASTQFLKRGG